VQKFLGRSRYWLPPLVAFALIGAWLRVWSPLPRAGRWNSWRLIALVVFLIASGAVLIYCGYFTGAYAMNFAPPPRSEIVMRYVFLMTGGAAGAVVGYLMAGLLTRKVMRALLAVASIVVLVFVIRDLSTMTNRTLRDARSMAIYAEAWDSLDRRLDNATTKQLVLFQPFRVDYASIVGVGTTRDQLQNSDCLHNYYEIDSLRILG
jgi:MFS family permease